MLLMTIPSMGTKEPVKINLGELGIVRAQYMPPHAVRFAPEEELQRVAEETGLKEPNLREEAHFVKNEELVRRLKLRQSHLVAVKGDLQRG